MGVRRGGGGIPQIRQKLFTKNSVHKRTAKYFRQKESLKRGRGVTPLADKICQTVFDRLPCQLKKITAFVWRGWVRGRVLLSYCTDIRKDFVLIDNNWHVVWCSRPYEFTVCSSKDPSICNQDPSTSAHITSISFIALDNNPGPFSWLRLEWNQGESL